VAEVDQEDAGMVENEEIAGATDADHHPEEAEAETTTTAAAETTEVADVIVIKK